MGLLGTFLIQFSESIARGNRETIMKSNFCTFVSVTFTLLCAVKYASSIFCYDCNSAFDPRCGPEFDPFSLGVVNCSLQDPPEHINYTEASLCRSIKMEIYGKTRVVRKCGYIEEAPSNATCRRVSGNGDVFVTYCACTTDLCNAGVSHQVGQMAVFSILLFCVVRML